MIVLPVAGRVIFDPATRRPVPPEGLTVPDNDFFWFRALSHGDVAMGGHDAFEALVAELHEHPEPSTPIAHTSQGDE